MVTYRDSLGPDRADDLHGFFVGWPQPPSPETHLAVLASSDHLVLAIDEPTGDVVGFITAISDGVLSAYISFLEVLPDYQRQGIGSELMRRLLRQLRVLYAIDLLCDPGLQSFYARLGMTPATGMTIRRHELASRLRTSPITHRPPVR